MVLRLVAVVGLVLCSCTSAYKEEFKDTCGSGATIDYIPSVKVAPSTFTIQWETSASDENLVIQIHRDWAPIGVDRFYQLIQDNYYDCAAFFRVVPDFVVQFGIASDPDETAKWNHEIRDDPVKQSNVRGTMSFATAGVDTRTTQLFINLKDNPRLDKMGFAPIGMVLSGMNVTLSIFNPTPGDGGGVDQDRYEKEGNAWLLAEYPDIDYIQSTTVRGLPIDTAESSSSSTNHLVSNTSAASHKDGQSKKATITPHPRNNLQFDSSTIPWIIIALVLLPLWTAAMFLKQLDDRRVRTERSQLRASGAASSDPIRRLPSVV